MNYEKPRYTTTSLSNNKLTKYETNQDTKPKTEYLKSGTIERYKTTKFTKKILTIMRMNIKTFELARCV